MSEQRVTVIDSSDDDREVDTSELQPLDDATASAAQPSGDDPDATVAVVVAEPPTPPLQLPSEAPERRGHPGSPAPWRQPHRRIGSLRA